MAQASVLYDDLGFDEDTIKEETYSYYPYVKFTQFTITNKWVGLLSDIKIYNKFIVNAWGIIRHEHEPLGSDDIPDSALFELDLKSRDEDDCLLPNQIINQAGAEYKPICVNDYNPHFYTGCGSMESQTVRYLSETCDNMKKAKITQEKCENYLKSIKK